MNLRHGLSPFHPATRPSTIQVYQKQNSLHRTKSENGPETWVDMHKAWLQFRSMPHAFQSGVHDASAQPNPLHLKPGMEMANPPSSPLV